MNWKKFFFAFIAAFIFLFLFGFLWYGTLMQGAHHEVPTLLRPETDFKSHFAWLVLGHLVMAFVFTILCARFVPAGGARTGATLGILVGLVYAGPHLISFAVQPLTFKILCGWILGAVIQFAIAGAIVGAIYKPATEQIMYVKERSR
jgi:phosphate/sulfate permease